MLEPTVLVVTTVPDPAGNSGGFFRQYSVALSLGMNLAIGMALFTVLGRYLGRLAGAKTAGTLGGMFAGLLYGAYEVWRATRELDHQQKERPESRRVDRKDHGRHSPTS